MNAASDLEQLIRSTIPLSEAMQFSIVELDQDHIRVTAPLEPNVNIHGTGFAGSIYSVAVLTGWALVTHLVNKSGCDADLVVAGAEISYRSPVTTVLDCSCACSRDQQEQFGRALAAGGKAKLSLEIEIGALPQARLQATYVAIVPG